MTLILRLSLKSPFNSMKPFRGAIFACTPEWLVGVDGTLPWHYPHDLKRFKQLTLNSCVLMGRKTFESIGSKPLPKRRNIVISRTKHLIDHIECATSVEMAYELIGNSPSWFIGGPQVFEAALDFLDVIDITFVPSQSVSGTPTYLRDLNTLGWRKTATILNPDDPRLSHTRYIK